MSTSYVTCYVIYTCRKTFKQPFTIFTIFRYWRLTFSLKKTLQHRYFPMNIAKFLKTIFYGITVYYTSPEFYVVMDIRYLKVIFCYCKMRPRSKKNSAIDQSKFLVKRCFFLSKDFNSPSKIFSYLTISLLQRFVRS